MKVMSMIAINALVIDKLLITSGPGRVPRLRLTQQFN